MLRDHPSGNVLPILTFYMFLMKLLLPYYNNKILNASFTSFHLTLNVCSGLI